MPTTFTLIDLAGSIALLLLGTQMVQTGMQRAFGAGLQLLLARLLRDRGHNSEAKIIPSAISLCGIAGTALWTGGAGTRNY
ncbi:hypothetical protein [Paraburkholderia hospita]|jgi:phosphate:Na+ symporter|uniref:hypothetical protein n=1 Tax=Paraburkholderia hospita TaxID=169430 RepID=UPI0008A7642A|nr:hypothetical protein [Paraburkholderia hospita]SEI21536.1 phosphate:Na+ symporter [Paraburkholderia hospita]